MSAVADSSRNPVAINRAVHPERLAQAASRRDEFGIPASTNLGRIQYTGQMWLTELGMYNYKHVLSSAERARIYSPTLGRFMQTDPIGYADGLNWYNYVRGDPVNATDPSGLEGASVDGFALAQSGWAVFGVRAANIADAAFILDYFKNGDRGLGGAGGGSGDDIVVPGKKPKPQPVRSALPPPQSGHEYEVDVDVSCSAGQAFDAYLAARSAPGAGRPNSGQTERNVQLFGGDWIRQTIDYSNRTILNETVQGRHRFDPGTVFISFTPIKGGSNISIIGRGTGNKELMNRAAFELFVRGGAYAKKVRCAVMRDGG